jgi:hypothetical protein
LSIFPWAVSIDLPYNIEGNTLTITRDIEGYYGKALDLFTNQPFIREVINNSYTELKVTKDMPEFGYLKPVYIGCQTAFTNTSWRQSYDLPGRSSYSIKVVEVNWPEEGYMPPCSLDDRPLPSTNTPRSITHRWEDVFDYEDEMYGDRVLNRLPDPYISEEEEEEEEEDEDGYEIVVPDYDEIDFFF